MSSLGHSSNQEATFQTSSLYVGDLAPDVSEGLLLEIFNAVGPVASIRVCRDANTRRSLGYAYVNFHQIGDAERALDILNYTMIKTRPCRIMWSQGDPSLRRSGVGSIVIKNLHESIETKQLYDTFSLFGNILSCTVVTDRETGGSKGCGYVRYETAEAANAAIDKLDGMLIDGQEVQVGHFMHRNERPGQIDWTICYVENVPLQWDDARLLEEFSKFGEVICCSITKGLRKATKKTMSILKEEAPEGEESEPAEGANEAGDSKEYSLGFGFVNFQQHETAAAAIEALNGKEYKTVDEDGQETTIQMYVGLRQKKAECELRAKLEGELLGLRRYMIIRALESVLQICLLLLPLVSGFLGQLASWTNFCRNSFKILSSTYNAYRFTPPSEDFCKSNTLHPLGDIWSNLFKPPDDTYSTIFKACELAFFKASSKPDHFSCDSYDKSMVIQIESRRVLLWYESCVAIGQRCYDLNDYPLLHFSTFHEFSNAAHYIGMPFPPGATVVSVDCTADYTEARLFFEENPEVPKFLQSLPYIIGIVLFVAVLTCICCCCCLCFFGARRMRRDNYRPVHVQHGVLLRPEAQANQHMHQD